ncbi:MAG TPA: mechanosensitive ion channel family protein [Alphaproteobacteria bacterium]|nr:mechanosensitive ion channel family protein [Alphaproteobacteria bacterium]
MFDKLIANVPRIIADYGASVFGSVIFLFGVWIFAFLFARLLRRVLSDHTELDPSYIAVIARTVRIVIMTLAGIAVLEELGVEIASLIAALGIFGFAIALGLRTPLANFFTGMMIYILKPYDDGDHIEGERVEGSVESIGAFHTVVVTPDGTHVSVPNSAMWARSIKNFSRPRPFRVDLTLTAGRELPFAELAVMIEKIVRADAVLYKDFPPEIRIVDTTEQALIIRVSAWCAAEEAWAFGDRLKAQIGAAMAAAGATVKKMIVSRKQPRPARKLKPPPKDKGEDFT